jgi:integrase
MCGLRWSDVDLKDGTLTVAHNRVSVNGQAMDFDPKTDGSGRTLPLTPALTAALRHAQATQKAERFALGPDYGQGEHVVCDEAGRAYHPDTMSNYWRALCLAAKVPSIRLHDARHTCGTLMPSGRADRGGVGMAWARRPGVHHADLCALSERRTQNRGDEFAASCVTVVSMRAGIEHVFARSETCFRR